MKFKIKNPWTANIVDLLAKQLATEVAEDCQRKSISIPAKYGKGVILSYTISDAIDALLFSGELKNKWELQFNKLDQAPVSFFTAAKGAFSCNHSHKKVEELSLEPLQSAIYVAPVRGQRTWAFPKGQNILFLALNIRKQVFFQDINCETLDVSEELLGVLTDLRGKQNFRFDDIFYLPIVDALSEIREQQDNGLLHSTFASSKLYEIMFLQLQQYQQKDHRAYGKTTKPDQGVALVRNAESILMSRIQDPPTIPELAKMVGINQQALKKGFKQLYGTTIRQYLNKERLKQAEVLIMNGQMKLREVALEVGYSNPSHFSRRFKEKYGVSPKYYAQQMQAQQ